jgi:hypothetical protein
MPEWVKEGLCVTCKYKDSCNKIAVIRYKRD